MFIIEPRRLPTHVTSSYWWVANTAAWVGDKSNPNNAKAAIEIAMRPARFALTVADSAHEVALIVLLALLPAATKKKRKRA